MTALPWITIVYGKTETKANPVSKKASISLPPLCTGNQCISDLE